MTTERLDELDALLADPAASFGDVAALAGEASAALRATWVERDNAMNTAKIATERAVYWMKYGETKAARLAEAEELLRQGPKQDTSCIVPVCDCLGCRIAAFLDRTAP